MSDEKGTDTIEVAEPTAPAAAKVETPTREELRAKGWSAAELDSAEKQGRIAKKDEKKEEAKAETAKAPEVKAEEKSPEKDEPKKEAPKRSSLPDFTFQTPEQEKAFMDAFGPGTPQRAMYFRMKNERQSRQAAESRNRELEARIQALESMKAERKVETDENGKEIDPEEKPLTLKQLREMQQKEAEEAQKKERELREQAQVVTEAQTAQEEYARSVLPDFDDSVKLAKEVMQNLDTLVPEKWKQGQVIDLVQKLQIAAANAHKLGLDDFNAAFIAHEIGKYHPNYGKSANGSKAETHTDGNPERPDTKANGGLTPEQMKRIEANTQRRASSASIPGGSGKRTVSVDDVDLAELNRMNLDERKRFKEKHPDKYAKLLRG